MPQSLRDIHREFKVDFKYDLLEPWDVYTAVVQDYIHIGKSPIRKDAYRLHKIAFWEELVPGVQRHFPASPFMTEPVEPPVEGGDKKPPPVAETTERHNIIPGAHATGAPSAEKRPRPEKSFMVELSMVIACGGFLLLLNVIVLGGIYYLRDKRKLEAKLAAKYLAQQEEKKRQDNISDDRPVMNHAPPSLGTTQSNHSGMSLQSYMRHDFIDGDIEFQV